MAQQRKMEMNMRGEMEGYHINDPSHAGIQCPNHLTPSPQTLMGIPGTPAKGAWEVCSSTGGSRSDRSGEREGVEGDQKKMRGWQELGVVETIYEEEQEEEDDDEEEEEERGQGGSKSPSLTTTTPTPTQSSSSSPSLPSLQNRVEAWSRATRCKPDVAIRVHDQCFHLHKEMMISQSNYLRRRLTECNEIRLSRPLNITAESFAAIAAFCYGADVALTPASFAAVRIAGELLEMGTLVGRTDEYFELEIAGEPESAELVLRECLAMIPDAAAVAIAGKCVEALAIASGGEADGIWVEDLAALSAETFVLIAEELRGREDHDVLYRIVDYYLEKHKKKVTEEDKNKICYAVDCTKLSHHRLLHLVQNPRMPLRFIVQAMLLDQLLARQCFYGRATTTTTTTTGTRKPPPIISDSNMTLGEILQRDSALRQTAQLRASMEATSFRIESLERDLAGLKQKLGVSKAEMEMDSVKSASFRFFREGEWGDDEEAADEVVNCPAAVVGSPTGASSKKGMSFGKKLLHGLKTVFRVSSSVKLEEGSSKVNGEVVVAGERGSRHRRNRSFA